MQEREAADGLALPLGGRNERHLILVQPVGPRVVVLRLPAEPAEQHDAEVGLADQLQLRCRVDQLRGLLGERGCRLDRLPVRVQPVHGEREPQRQPTRPPGQLVGVVRRVPLALATCG